MILKRIMKLKSNGDDVLLLQQKLKGFGFFIDKPSGYYNQNTLMSVSNFQKHTGLEITGEVNIHTWSKLIDFDKKPINNNKVNKLVTITNNDLKIYDTSESVDFYKEESLKDTILISNSGIGYNPNLVINSWKPIYKETDNFLKRSSHFIIGRKSDSIDKWDGLVVKSFDDEYWSYPCNLDNAKSIISIEICNYGPITKFENKFYNITGNLVDDKEVIELNYLGYNYYHKYTDFQIQNLKKLLVYLQLKHGIQIKRGTYTENGLLSFYDDNWFINHNSTLGGIKTKNNFNIELLGISPQKGIIDMLDAI